MAEVTIRVWSSWANDPDPMGGRSPAVVLAYPCRRSRTIGFQETEGAELVTVEMVVDESTHQTIDQDSNYFVWWHDGE